MNSPLYILSLLIEKQTRNPAGYWTVDKETLTHIQSIPGSKELIRIEPYANLYMIFNLDSHKCFRGKESVRLEIETLRQNRRTKDKYRNTLLNALEARAVRSGFPKANIALLRDLASTALKECDYIIFKKFKLLPQVEIYLDAIKAKADKC